MYRLLLFIFLFISSNAFSQTETTLPGSLPKQLIDSTQVVNDSALVVSDSLLVSDSLAIHKIISDSLKALQQKADSLIIFTGKPFFDGSIILSHSDLLKNDYKYTGDFFRLSGISFTKDYGFIGQNNETMIYGIGFGGISYFEDGVLLNPSYMLDLNNVPSESIDSIEILPAVRGFLYGIISNPVSVNFITKDRTPRSAFSRIKYYEGPFGDAMIDGIFSTTLYRKMFLYFEASNRKVDSRYVNSSFSNWLGKIKLKYLLNDFLNLQASYGYVKSVKGLNGGVDVNSIRSVTSNVDSLLYNEILAPVKSSESSYDAIQHNFGFRLLSEIGSISKTDFNLYYKFGLDELNNMNLSNIVDIDSKEKIYGISLKQNFTSGIFEGEVNGIYEYSDFFERTYFYSAFDTLKIGLSERDFKNYSISTILSLNTLNNSLKISTFFKFGGRNIYAYNNSYQLNGGGLDLVFSLNDKIRVYCGYSIYEPLYSRKNVSTIEGAINYSEENFSSEVRIFMRQSDPTIYRYSNISFHPFQDMLGVELNLKTKFWKLLFEGRGSFYSEASDETTVYNIPAQHFNAGIYFSDTLFNSNLDLKTGFVFYFSGKQNLFNYSVPASSRIDFTLAGEIQKTAIAYFTWENLLGAEYFIVPYYPMPLRGIRFGVSWEFLN